MIELNAFKGLPPREQALIAVAVLIDGMEASSYFDAPEAGQAVDLRAIAGQLATISPELRMPLLGSLLRSALENLKRGQK